MQTIRGILFEPVGCLAEFPSAPFNTILELFDLNQDADNSGSQAYWRLLEAMDGTERLSDTSERAGVERLELEAVDAAVLYEDVGPALEELQHIGVPLLVASSLSEAAVTRFLDRNRLAQFFTEVWDRDKAGGIRSAPLARALAAASLTPEQVIYLVDTEAGIRVSREAGVNAVLMIDDPDEAMRLAMLNPAGGVVSLHELGDFVRLVAAENARLTS